VGGGDHPRLLSGRVSGAPLARRSPGRQSTVHRGACPARSSPGT
jgi:hypothetical protein